MNKISAIIITFNEELNIGRCIESLQGVADEIVVLDSFSTDRTKEICATYKVIFHAHAFDGFAQQKNRAAGLASHPILLSLDADEALSEPLRKSILAAKENWEADAYSLNRLTNYCGTWVRHCGWYPDKKLRLYDRDKALWEGKKVHEKLALTPGSRTKHLNGDLLHYSFYTIQQHIQTTNSFTTLQAEEMFESGRRVGMAKLLLSPAFKFFNIYFLKSGWLDGFAGLLIAVNSAHGVFMKYSKLRMMYHKHFQSGL